MNSMFQGASSFDQPISKWQGGVYLSNITNGGSGYTDNTMCRLINQGW